MRTSDSAATAQLFGLLIKQKYRVEIATTIDCEGNGISISTGVIMTANAEAQSLLDQLMGADRNALLPTGKKFYGVCVRERYFVFGGQMCYSYCTKQG